MNYNNFLSLYDMIIGTVASIATALLLGYLQNKVSTKRLTTLFTILIVSIIVIIANFSVKTLVANSSAIRYSIDPDNYIEGYWYELTVDSNATIKHETLTSIAFREGKYVISGEVFDTLGNSYANFISTASAYQNGNLFFEYTSNNSKHGIGHGFDQLQFTNPPNQYKGFVYSSTSKRYYPIEGNRIKNQQLKEFNNLEDRIDRKNFILNLIKNNK